jgi:DNA integrity scanning protein DisA with diadenylate cyclase activity
MTNENAVAVIEDQGGAVTQYASPRIGAAVYMEKRKVLDEVVSKVLVHGVGS